MTNRGFLYTVLLSLISTVAFAQKIPVQEDMARLAAMEDTLAVYADSMYKAAFPDEKSNYCVKFVKTLKRALEVRGSFGYPFDKIKDKVHIIIPDDKNFRIFNWVLTVDEFRRRYYGAIQMNTEDGSLKLYPLTDASESMELNGEMQQVTAKEWYGCEYYRVLSGTNGNGEKIYTLFGYNNNGSYSTKKLLDALMFTENGPVFGWPVFAIADDRDRLEGSPLKKRFILEYKKKATIALNYDETKKMILFDRLMSEINDPKRKNTMVPSGQTDAFEWRNGVWVYNPEPVRVLKLEDGQAPINGVMPGGK